MDPLDVGVIGLGTAGPAAALFLARAGHRVTLYERVPKPGPIGAGIMLQPSGMSVLAALGLLDGVLARGAVIHGLTVENAQGRTVMQLRYTDLAADLYGLGLHRGVLFETLLRAVERTPGIALRLGVDVEDLARDQRGRNLIVERGSGARHGPHDLIVVGDGARSRLRDDAALGKRVRPYPWGALWFVAKDERRVFHRRLFQVVDGTGTLLGLLPTGLGPAHQVPLLSLFWSLRADRLAAWRAAGLDGWKERIQGYVPEADFILDQIQSPDDVLFSEYRDVVMRRWHTADVVYLGDAAHATSPQLGQGCNLALVDAQVLAECLAAHDTLAPALADYTDRRRSHLGYYQLATRWLTPFFQSDHGWLGPIRDHLFGLASRWPIAGKLMLAGMAGISRGPFRKTLPLAHRPPQLKE